MSSTKFGFYFWFQFSLRLLLLISSNVSTSDGPNIFTTFNNYITILILLFLYAFSFPFIFILIFCNKIYKLFTILFTCCYYIIIWFFCYISHCALTKSFACPQSLFALRLLILFFCKPIYFTEPNRNFSKCLTSS